MGIKILLDNGMNSILKNGVSTSVNIISIVRNGSDYDDVGSDTWIGSSTASGLVFPVRGTQGSEEAVLLQQGKLLTQDKVLYLPGSVNFSGNVLVNFGTEYYSILADGIHTYNVNGSPIYNKLFIRYTQNGSLYV